MALLSGLQSLTFGFRFNEAVGKGALPSGLQSLTVGSEFKLKHEEGGSAKRPAELDLWALG